MGLRRRRPACDCHDLTALHRRRVLDLPAPSFSLIEVAAVLAIGGIVLAGVMFAFRGTGEARKGVSALAEVAAVQQAVRTLYASQPGYTGVSADILASSGHMPRAMVAPAGLRHVHGGPVTVTALEDGRQFAVELGGLPTAACRELAALDLGAGLVRVVVVNGAARAVADGQPLTAAAAARICGERPSTLTWVFS